jgi:parallel beta-helix repeat protein
VLNNYIADSEWDGIDLKGSQNNNIKGNTITKCFTGIYLGSETDNMNVIYHNNFINNMYQVTCYSTPNMWDDGYPSGGNYWSDYTGVDVYSGPNQNETGSDGVGDKSYVINTDNTDRYPLMGPISFFNAGTWDETTYYVHTVSNSTILDFYFSKDDKLLGFDVTGPDDTVGFCRVAIPNELLWCDNPEQWQIWVNNTLIEDRNVMGDTSYVYIYFTYNQSTQNVEVVGVHVTPEFPTWTSMLLILILLTAAIAIYKRRLLKTPIH